MNPTGQENGYTNALYITNAFISKFFYCNTIFPLGDYRRDAIYVMVLCSKNISLLD